MKYVMQTQFKENYGAHDWDGTGECPQYWKFKGGETYIVDVSMAQAQTKCFMEQCEDAVSSADDYQEEYVLDAQLIDDCDFDVSNHIESWETPTYLQHIGENEFVGYKIVENGTMGYMKKEIVKQQRSWKIIDGVESDHKCVYEMVTGHQVPHADLKEWFEKYTECEVA